MQNGPQLNTANTVQQKHRQLTKLSVCSSLCTTFLHQTLLLLQVKPKTNQTVSITVESTTDTDPISQYLEKFTNLHTSCSNFSNSAVLHGITLAVMSSSIWTIFAEIMYDSKELLWVFKKIIRCLQTVHELFLSLQAYETKTTLFIPLLVPQHGTLCLEAPTDVDHLYL